MGGDHEQEAWGPSYTDSGQAISSPAARHDPKPLDEPSDTT